MALWSVKPEWKKSVIERNYLVKGKNRLMVETGWRWGEFTVETEDDNPPEIEAGVDIFNCDYNGELVETTDGCWDDYDYDECDPITQEWLEEFFDEGNSWLDLTDEHGWVHDDCEMIIDCDLIIERLDDDGNPTGKIVGDTEDADVEIYESSENKNTTILNPNAAWPFSNATEPTQYAEFKCTNCDFKTTDIMDLIENPNDDDKGALLCPKCNSKVEM